MALALLGMVMVTAATVGFGAYHAARAITGKIVASSMTCFAVTSLTGFVVTIAVEKAGVL